MLSAAPGVEAAVSSYGLTALCNRSYFRGGNCTTILNLCGHCTYLSQCLRARQTNFLMKF